MTNDTNLHEPLKRYFGFETFRNNQEAIIRSLMAGHDVFVLMPLVEENQYATNFQHYSWMVWLSLCLHSSR